MPQNRQYLLKISRTTMSRPFESPCLLGADLCRFVHLSLLTAERAWAQAMQMKSAHSQAESGGKPIQGSTKRQINSRLHKAAVYAKHLLEILEDRESGAQAEDVLEARAYHISLKGAVEFEKRSWERCLQAYSESRLVYATMAKSGNAKRDDMFRDLLSSNIDPSIRYAAYQLKLPRTLPLPTIVTRYLPRTDNQYVQQLLTLYPDALDEGRTGQKKGSGGELENIPRTIRWRSREVDLEDAATAQALAGVSTAESKLSSFLISESESDAKVKASAFDEILIQSQDAVDAAKSAIDELASEGVAQGDRRMQALQITRTAVNYALVGWRIGRNRVLCGDQDGAFPPTGAAKKAIKSRKDGKPREPQDESKGRKLAKLGERVVLYDAILQSLDSVKELPGIAADQPFVQELNAKRAYFAALRCLSIARSYSLLADSKKALALFARAFEICPPTSSFTTVEIDPKKPPNIDVATIQAESLHKMLRALVSQHRALVELQNLSAEAAREDERKSKHALPMIERLDEYPANGADLTNLVTYPPKLQPVPVKPLFFDIAWNYLEYPGRAKSGKVAVNGAMDGVASQPQPKKDVKKGWFGFGR